MCPLLADSHCRDYARFSLPLYLNVGYRSRSVRRFLRVPLTDFAYGRLQAPQREKAVDDYPASPKCQIFMTLYVLICLILPLCGCIVCYSSIVYQLAVIKKNRENMTNSSTAGPVPQSPADQIVPMVDQDVEREVPAAPIKSNTVQSLKQHLQRQTNVISQKAK